MNEFLLNAAIMVIGMFFGFLFGVNIALRHGIETGYTKAIEQFMAEMEADRDRR